MCTAPWRVGFEQRLRRLLQFPGAVLPALTPLYLPKTPPGGTEFPWQLRLLVTRAVSPHQGGGRNMVYYGVRLRNPSFIGFSI